MPEEPNGRLRPRIPTQPRDILSLARVATLTGPNLRFRAVDFDVARLKAGIWFAGIRAADIGDFKHHVRLPVLIPKGYADVWSAVTCI